MFKHATIIFTLMLLAGGYSRLEANAFTWKAGSEYGFNAVNYTGDGSASHAIPHGLNGTPDMVWIKPLDRTQGCLVFFRSWGAPNYAFLNTSNSLYDTATCFIQNPDENNVYIGGNPDINGSGNNFALYAWKSTEGLSSIGEYKGNASADGPFVYTGFKPSNILLRKTGSGNWMWSNHLRPGYNVNMSRVNVNDQGIETTNTNMQIDYLSNGFKIRDSSSYDNASGVRMVYVAFADLPAKYANAQ